MNSADAPLAGPRRVRITHFCPWADGWEETAAFLGRLPTLDVAARTAQSGDGRLRTMARLDCDWHGENARCFAALQHPQVEFLSPHVVGVAGLADFLQAAARRPPGMADWLLFMGQHPQTLAGTWGRLGPFLQRTRCRTLYYAFDEASRTMPAFEEMAPWIDVLIHDESPLGSAAQRLRHDARCVHRSWVANVLPFAVPFVENPEPGIVFLGSQMGLTPHRQRQIDFLARRFKDQFHAIHDHSLPVARRAELNRWSVSLSPEGRKFATPAMAATHTDRPFWSGCLGMVPVSEDSFAGGRLEDLHREGLILRYAHGDLEDLTRACERALSLGAAERRRIYDHFNRRETVGTVVAEEIARSASEPTFASS